MNHVSVRLVPRVINIKPHIKVKLTLKSNSVVNVARGLCQYSRNEFMRNGCILYNASSAVNSTFLFLNGKQIQKHQQRHFSKDYMDGRVFYNWLSESTPVEYTKNFLVSVHDYTGLPWWGTIICTTVALRCTITLPLAIYQAYIISKVENLALIDMPEVSREVKKEVAILALKNKWDDRRTQIIYKRMLKSKWDGLVVRDNCHPLKGTITLWFQLPMWIFFTAALRNIAYLAPFDDAAAQVQFLQMCVGGFLWIPNLTLPDHTWFFPAILGFSNLTIIELQALRRVRQGHNFQRYVTNFFRCLSLLLIPISATVPSAVCLYWTTSSLIGLGQNLFLMSNRVRHFCHIPDTPSTLDNPYLQLMVDIKERGRMFKVLFKRRGKSETNN